MNFVLASGSPRRRELMNIISAEYETVAPDVDESVISDKTPSGVYVQELALLKAAAAAKRYVKKRNTIIIAADTIVTVDGRILGKPLDFKDARNTLIMLSGRTHEVYTGFCIMRMSDAFTVCSRVKTEVTFGDLTTEKIDAYIKTGEPMDKAGSYGIQGLGSLFVKEIKGDYFNVVGFPVFEIAQVLEKEFNINILTSNK